LLVKMCVCSTKHLEVDEQCRIVRHARVAMDLEGAENDVDSNDKLRD
jgi:hypothetical protein